MSSPPNSPRRSRDRDLISIRYKYPHSIFWKENILIKKLLKRGVSEKALRYFYDEKIYCSDLTNLHDEFWDGFEYAKDLVWDIINGGEISPKELSISFEESCRITRLYRRLGGPGAISPF